MTLSDLEMESGMIRKKEASTKQICALAFEHVLVKNIASTDPDFAQAFLEKTFMLMAAAGFHRSYAEASFRHINQRFLELLRGVRPAKSAKRDFRREIANSVEAPQGVVEACLSAAARTCLEWCIFLRVASYAQALLSHAQAKGKTLKRMARQLEAALPRNRLLQLSSKVALPLRSRACGAPRPLPVPLRLRLPWLLPKPLRAALPPPSHSLVDYVRCALDVP